MVNIDHIIKKNLRQLINEVEIKPSGVALDNVCNTKKTNSNDDLPFEEKIDEGIKYRTFKSDVNTDELKWHFDKQNREVTILESNGWEFQMDDELPKILKEGDVLFIPKNIYHRVKRGKGDLKIKIKEY